MKTNKDAVTLSVFLSLFAESVNFMLATSYIFHLAPIMTQKYFIKVQKCLKTDYSDRVNALSTTAWQCLPLVMACFFKFCKNSACVTNVQWHRPNWRSCRPVGARGLGGQGGASRGELWAVFLPCWVTGCAAGRSWTIQGEREACDLLTLNPALTWVTAHKFTNGAQRTQRGCREDNRPRGN